MIKITNGQNVLVVTTGAYKNVYSKKGFVPLVDQAEKTKKDDNNLKQAVNESPEVPNVPDKGTGNNEEDLLDGDNELTEEQKVFISEFEEKPASGWSKKDLKEYCVLKQIDVTGLSFDEAKELVKNKVNG